jgi:hypothetical protein
MNKNKKGSLLLGTFVVVWTTFLCLLGLFEPKIHKIGWPAMTILLWILGVTCIVLFVLHLVFVLQLESEQKRIETTQ